MQQIAASGLYEDEESGYPDEEMETLHVYIYPDSPSYWNKERLVALCMGLLALAMIVGLCCIPDAPNYVIETITVPARISPQQMRVSVEIIPTGKHVYPAAQARGILTIYNGSFLTEQLPAHFLLTASNGVEVETDQAAAIPAGNPPAYGIATVAAHASRAGSAGNIQAFAIQQTYGNALYIKNLSAFTGGHDATNTTYATSQDVRDALESARQQLNVKQPIGLLAQPCNETASQKELQLLVTRVCQYVTYTVPKGTEVLSVNVRGMIVVLRVKREIVTQWKRH